MSKNVGNALKNITKYPSFLNKSYNIKCSTKLSHKDKIIDNKELIMFLKQESSRTMWRQKL